MYKVVIEFKTFNTSVFAGAEMKYKPEGGPSFELESYIIDSDLEVIRKVLAEGAINSQDIFACGDLK